MKPMEWFWLVVAVLVMLPLVAISGGLKKVWLTWKGKRIK
jgi:hypothetical protein